MPPASVLLRLVCGRVVLIIIIIVNTTPSAFVKAGKTIGGALTASGKGGARDRCAEATEGTQARPWALPVAREARDGTEASDAR